MGCILNKKQAQAVFDAMNNLACIDSRGSRIELKNECGHTIQIHHRSDGLIVVALITGGLVLGSDVLVFPDRDAFSDAYELTDKN